MPTLAVMNQKGGSGKTTTAVNLAAALAERGIRVLLVDLDPQANASTWFGIHAAERNAFTVLTKGQSPAAAIQRTAIKSLDVLPSSRELANATIDRDTLAGKLSSLKAAGYGWTILDCPPALNLITINALAAANRVLIPVEAHSMALSGLAQLLQTLKEIQNPALRIAGIVACRVDGRTRHALDIVEKLRTELPDLVLKRVIRENVKLAECYSFGKPITLYDTKSTGAEDHRALAKELLKREKP